MRWNYKGTVAERNEKKAKTWRVKTRFAFFPVVTTLPHKEVLWLELYQTNDKWTRKVFSNEEWYWRVIQTAAMGYWSDS